MSRRRQVSAQGAIRLGKRQCEELAIAAACDFDAFYASRLPEPREACTGLLLTADGSAFPVLPGALRPATAKAAAARARQAAESGWPDDPSDLRKSRKRMAELAAVAVRLRPPPGRGGDRRRVRRRVRRGTPPRSWAPAAWFAVVDGNNHQIETITALAAEHGATVPVLIDLIHVTQYLWKAGPR